MKSDLIIDILDFISCISVIAIVLIMFGVWGSRPVSIESMLPDTEDIALNLQQLSAWQNANFLLYNPRAIATSCECEGF